MLKDPYLDRFQRDWVLKGGRKSNGEDAGAYLVVTPKV